MPSHISKCLKKTDYLKSREKLFHKKAKTVDNQMTEMVTPRLLRMVSSWSVRLKKSN